MRHTYISLNIYLESNFVVFIIPDLVYLHSVGLEILNKDMTYFAFKNTSLSI